jgi:glucose/mannose-6-phosphate isomerase
MLENEIKRLDKSDMLGTIASLPGQLRGGLDIGLRAWEGLGGLEPGEIVVAGMGGSAIGADVLRAYLVGRGSGPVFVCRDYDLPAFVGPGTLVVVSSYSGNTEEALSCLEDGVRRGADMVCISTGGTVIKRARGLGLPHAVIPAGLPPRGALGYSFAPLLALASAVGFHEHDPGEYAECVDVLERLIGLYSDLDGEGNPAARLAAKLVDRIPIVYTSNRLDTVGVRWKGQFSENSKKLAYANVLPEMNHNEIMGWEVEDASMAPGVVLLRWAGDNKQMGKRFRFLGEVVGARSALCGEFTGEGEGFLSQMFSLIVLGDYVSVYLALLRGVDPTPVGTIEKLKTRLKEN